MQLWDHQPLSDDDSEFWENLRSAAPNWAIFRRLELSDENRMVRERMERDCEKAVEEVFADADELTVCEVRPGIQSISATFWLNKEQSHKDQKSTWWKRWAARLRRFIHR
ncbi:MAG TPA: hypothetical protein VKZ53_14795 [Candidatus Angelobacter sp.]|nr:hypothetical protein [Candidatus Angelobacter sp.]